VTSEQWSLLFVQLSLIVTIGHTWLQYGSKWHALTHWRLNWFLPPSYYSQSLVQPGIYKSIAKFVAIMYEAIRPFKIGIDTNIWSNHFFMFFFFFFSRITSKLQNCVRSFDRRFHLNPTFIIRPSLPYKSGIKCNIFFIGYFI